MNFLSLTQTNVRAEVGWGVKHGSESGLFNFYQSPLICSLASASPCYIVNSAFFFFKTDIRIPAGGSIHFILDTAVTGGTADQDSLIIYMSTITTTIPTMTGTNLFCVHVDRTQNSKTIVCTNTGELIADFEYEFNIKFALFPGAPDVVVN